MKRKTLYLFEAVIVILILSILIYTFVPKAMKSQHRAQIAQLEEAMQAVKQYLTDHPNDNSIIHDNAGSYSMFISGPHYNQKTQTGTLLYTKSDVMDLQTENLSNYSPGIHIPDWTYSDLKMAGYAVYSKISPQHTVVEGFSDIPVYVAVIARVGEVDDMHFMNTPYFVNTDEQGNLKYNAHFTPFDVSNGLTSYGEFFVDTADVWDATTAVVLERPPEGMVPSWWKDNEK